MTIMIAPSEPLLAGTPMANAHSPEKLYMPHELMRERQARTVDALKTRSPVVGQMPPLAKTAVTTASIAGVTWIEHVIK